MPDPAPPPASPTAPPPTPPTPPVPLAALLAREDLGLRQVAGPDARAAGTAVQWVHTSEMADPYPYLLGGELLLTAGVHITDPADPADAGGSLDAYVARIVAAGGAALGFGVAPVHDTVPDALVAACDHYGLPLVEVPRRTTFSGVARAVWRLMAEARHAELRRVTEAQQGLATAAARTDPVPAVLRQLASRLSGTAVLYGPDGTELQSAGLMREAARDALRDLTGVVRRAAPAAPASAADTAGATHLAAYALGGGRGFALGVATDRREPGDHTIAGAAVVLLSLLTGEHQSTSEAARSTALVRLLLGAPAHEVGTLLGSDLWTVVHARGEQTTPLSASALAAALGTALVDPGEHAVRLLVPADRELTPLEGWTLGASAPAPAAGLAAADAQAARALRRAEATRVPLIRQHANGVADLIAPEEADAHARVLLSPLSDNEPLLSTLRTWLSLHGSWDRTAVALGIHRNTVRQRITRCTTLLGTDLNDPDVRMELWFALSRAH
ncbi:PucR family transcriptional regulator [Streptomyces sp. Je 1-369]|uniref:PucR family transcriptional regulator n=1 Tax=Streptomyces sp. Je 1-369 TaxID=2966192 RepID=UPI002285512E|nr:PucR family transcriptional regulator [Streptomyces sp. Je 1-369]WAL95616.1 PucR family transcriptional regulator [Streptomyces sp. Je 1-369]